MNKKYLKFHPEADINLNICSGGKDQNGYIILENLSDDTVAFKFRSSNSHDMTVAPANGILAPREQKHVQINYTNRRSGGGKERLLVLVAPLDETFHTDKDFVGLFKRNEDDALLQEHKFHVTYHPDTGRTTVLPNVQATSSPRARAKPPGAVVVPVPTAVYPTQPQIEAKKHSEPRREMSSRRSVVYTNSPEPEHVVLVRNADLVQPETTSEVKDVDLFGVKLPEPSDATSRSSNGLWEAQRHRALEQNRPASAAHNRKHPEYNHHPHHPHQPPQHHHQPLPPPPQRYHYQHPQLVEEASHDSFEDLPNYNLTLAAPRSRAAPLGHSSPARPPETCDSVSECMILTSSEDDIPIGQRLMKKFSHLGKLLMELADDANTLRRNQKSTMIIFSFVLVLLFILFAFLVILPLWRFNCGRHHLVLPTISVYDSLGYAAAELGELFFEDRRGMTLDEYIHWKMS